MTAAAAPAPQGSPQAEPGKRPGLFGARRRLEGLEAEHAYAQQRIGMLEAELARHRHDAGRTIHQLQSRVASLQNKDAAALEQETRAVGARLHQVREELGRAGEARLREEVAVRDARDESVRVRRDNQTRIDDAQREGARLIAAARTEAEQAAAAQRAEAERVRADSAREARECQDRLDELERQVVATEDLVMLQQAGVYEFRHRLDDAVAYKVQLDHLKEAIKTLVRRDSAILSTTSWTVNGSTAEGRKMVRDFSKLMLRAYNAEADNCVRTMRPHRLASSIERLERARDSIAKLGATMHIRIDAGYHSVRLQELELTADYLAKQEEEKERIRAERERQRDEDAARKEFEREKTRLAKEKAHWERVQAQWIAAGEDTKVSEAADKLEQLDEAIAGVEAREANIRTGWVYVISNIGAFGQDMVKIGLTRRLDPRERVRELGDASVPFKFDVHALVFSEDAVGLETRLHRELADRRVNRVNLRREFFRATPAEVLAALEKTEARDHLLEFTELAEAPEWRASQTAISAAGGS